MVSENGATFKVKEIFLDLCLFWNILVLDVRFAINTPACVPITDYHCSLIKNLGDTRIYCGKSIIIEE